MTHGKALMHYGIPHRQAAPAATVSVGHTLTSWSARLLLAVIAIAWAAEIRHHLPTFLAALQRHI
jgi:hypothetical protein